jgi:hypothetical protein
MRIRDAGALFLLCEECESAWPTPEEIDVKTHYDFQSRSIDYASSQDIDRFGWFRYPLTQD